MLPLSLHYFKNIFGRIRNSSLPSVAPTLWVQITENKRQNFILPKLPSATSFILVPLCEIAPNFENIKSSEKKNKNFGFISIKINK